ncbi:MULTISPECIES: transcriptional repressor [unclassified Methanosarcina]|uniref:transcriptional repressor n=1 Tax=unclassified Methanosarcina TaxID=2644672 RepID=UPI00350F4FC4
MGQLFLHNLAYLAVQRIYNEVKKVYPVFGLATIYKTVHTLKEAGLIQELNLKQIRQI